MSRHDANNDALQELAMTCSMAVDTSFESMADTLAAVSVKLRALSADRGEAVPFAFYDADRARFFWLNEDEGCPQQVFGIVNLYTTTPSPAETTKAPWDTKALEVAGRIALMWGEDRSQFVAKIQVAVLEAMQWASPAESAEGVTVDPDWLLPCDVRVEPATTISKGCKLSTLLHSLALRAQPNPVADADLQGLGTLIRTLRGHDCQREVESPCPECGADNEADGAVFVPRDKLRAWRTMIDVAPAGVQGDITDLLTALPTHAAPSQVSDAMVERAAKAVERMTTAASYGWTDEQFEIWWNKDPSFVERRTIWGWFSGTRKEKLLAETRAALEAAQTQPGRVEGMDRG